MPLKVAPVASTRSPAVSPPMLTSSGVTPSVTAASPLNRMLPSDIAPPMSLEKNDPNPAFEAATLTVPSPVLALSAPPRLTLVMTMLAGLL